ncbi:hypothetical protein SLS55_008933 [Diplodia seriata]|uniref:Uncharacterized protein n=1 Tax=Diplodia seriata TaxID=420778 RepID=A0ABR3C7D2_9PEZI
MDQYPAKLSQPHQWAAPPPPDCGTNPTVHEPLPYPPTSFDPNSFTCITTPYGTHAAPNFAECCDSPVASFTTVHLTSEGPSSCAAYCSVKPHRLLFSDYRSSEFHTCVFGGPEEDKDVQLECWDGEGFVGDLDWEHRFTEKDDSSNKHKKRNPQQESSTSTTTYNPSFWSSLISAAATETVTPILLTDSSTTITATYDSSIWSSLLSVAATDTASVGLPVLSTTTTTTAANGTAASSSDASLATGTFVSVSEVSGTRSSTGAASSTSPAATSASATSDAASSGGSTASSSASAAESSSTSGASSTHFKGAYGRWLCTGLLLSVVFMSLQ